MGHEPKGVLYPRLVLISSYFAFAGALVSGLLRYPRVLSGEIIDSEQLLGTSLHLMHTPEEQTREFAIHS